ncbi:MAG: hypothetical protein ACJ8CS_19320 [Microvirga sp.]
MARGGLKNGPSTKQGMQSGGKRANAEPKAQAQGKGQAQGRQRSQGQNQKK